MHFGRRDRKDRVHAGEKTHSGMVEEAGDNSCAFDEPKMVSASSKISLGDNSYQTSGKADLVLVWYGNR